MAKRSLHADIRGINGQNEDDCILEKEVEIYYDQEETIVVDTGDGYISHSTSVSASLLSKKPLF